MKRIFLSVAILAMFASCSKNEVTSVIPEVNQGIGFNTLRDVATRAANDHTTGNISNYSVYAQYNTATAGWYFTDYELTSGDAAVTSGESYIWPLVATNTLDFAAFAPAATVASEITITETPTVPTAGTKGSVQVAATLVNGKVDFTVATPLVNKHTPGVDLPLVFEHMTSKITVSAAIDAALTGYELVGTPTVSFTPINNVVTVADIFTATPAGVASSNTPLAYTNTEAGLLATANATSTAGSTFYIAPHTAAQNICTVSISGLTLQKNNDTAPQALTLTKTFTVDTQAFEAGKAYNLKFTVGSSASVITFSSSTATWGTANDVTL